MLDLIQELKSWLDKGGSILQRLEDQGFQLDSVMHGKVSKPPAPKPSPPPPPPLRVIEPPTPAPASTTFPGEHASEYLATVKSACQEYGLFSDCLRAIEVWETGHFAEVLDGKRTLFADTNNPGGIKRASSLGPEYQLPAHADHPSYCRFPSWQEGVRLHAKFLTRPLYAEALHAATDEEQATAIWKAGYSELDPGWINGVIALLHQYQHEIVVPPATPGLSVTQRIRQAALARVGASSKADPGTDQGELACAYEASGILIAAGVLEESERQLSVAGLVQLLQAKGWFSVSQPYQDGDVPEWAPWQGGTHGHTGVFIKQDGVIYAVNNHSSIAAVASDKLSTYGRPLVRVLRAPGA